MYPILLGKKKPFFFFFGLEPEVLSGILLDVFGLIALFQSVWHNWVNKLAQVSVCF